MMRLPISDCGIVASTTSQPGQPGRASKPRIWPRRCGTIAVTLAVASEGVWISTFMTGSSSTGEQAVMPSFMPIRAAIWNAMSEESTV